MSRETLVKLGAADATVAALLANDFYTPVDIAAIADALERMGAMRGLDAIVSHAASARTRDAAYLIRRRIELTAAYQQRTHRITGFAQWDNAPFPLATSADNGVVGVFPFDSVAWTKDVAGMFAALSAGAARSGVRGAKTLAITGAATPLARRNLAALGWTLREHMPR
jgi:hypothetical protein